MQSTILVAFLFAFPTSAAVAAPPQDSCSRLLPSGLLEAVASQFPKYRLPFEADNSPDDIRAQQEQGGSGCLGVSIGRYRGGTADDYALLLSSRSSDDKALLVVASRRASQWRLDVLRDWGVGRGGFYVASVRPGRYSRTQSLDGPPSEPHELSHFTSSLPGVISGRVQSSGVAYFFTGSRWVHVWVSD